jgi:hypothetical protein
MELLAPHGPLIPPVVAIPPMPTLLEITAGRSVIVSRGVGLQRILAVISIATTLRLHADHIHLVS